MTETVTVCKRQFLSANIFIMERKGWPGGKVREGDVMMGAESGRLKMLCCWL